MLMRSPARRTRPTRRAPPGFILPAQPVLALKPPIGPGWLFAVKHDGFRIVARKEGDGVHLWSRNGRDWSVEFSGITAALKAWKVKSCVRHSVTSAFSGFQTVMSIEGPEQCSAASTVQVEPVMRTQARSISGHKLSAVPSARLISLSGDLPRSPPVRPGGLFHAVPAVAPGNDAIVNAREQWRGCAFRSFAELRISGF